MQSGQVGVALGCAVGFDMAAGAAEGLAAAEGLGVPVVLGLLGAALVLVGGG